MSDGLSNAVRDPRPPTCSRKFTLQLFYALCNNNNQNVKEKKNPHGDIKEKVGAVFVLERPGQLWHSLGFVRLSHSIPTQIVLNGWYVKPSCIWNVEEAWSGRRSCQVLGNPGILAGWALGGRAPAPGVGFFTASRT